MPSIKMFSVLGLFSAFLSANSANAQVISIRDHDKMVVYLNGFGSDAVGIVKIRMDACVALGRCINVWESTAINTRDPKQIRKMTDSSNPAKRMSLTPTFTRAQLDDWRFQGLEKFSAKIRSGDEKFYFSFSISVQNKDGKFTQKSLPYNYDLPSKIQIEKCEDRGKTKIEDFVTMPNLGPIATNLSVMTYLNRK